MSDNHDPLSSSASAIVRVARGEDGPSDADRSRLRGNISAAVAATIAAGAASKASAASAQAAPAAAATAAGSGITIAAKLTVIVALALGGGAGVYVATRGPASEAEPVPVPVTVPAAALSAELPSSGSENRAAPRAEEAPIADPETTAASPARIKPRAKKIDATESSASASVGDLGDLENERTLVDAAARALQNGDPKRAVALLDEAALLFPTPTFAEEQAATRILALCALGRTSEARGKIELFQRRYASSAHITRIERDCRAD